MDRAAAGEVDMWLRINSRQALAIDVIANLIEGNA
jgi:hypothetical protein